MSEPDSLATLFQVESGVTHQREASATSAMPTEIMLQVKNVTTEEDYGSKFIWLPTCQFTNLLFSHVFIYKVDQNRWENLYTFLYPSPPEKAKELII